MSDINAEMAAELMDLRGEVPYLRQQNTILRMQRLNAEGLEEYIVEQLDRAKAFTTTDQYRVWRDDVQRGVTARMNP